MHFNLMIFSCIFSSCGDYLLHRDLVFSNVFYVFVHVVRISHPKDLFHGERAFCDVHDVFLLVNLRSFLNLKNGLLHNVRGLLIRFFSEIHVIHNVDHPYVICHEVCAQVNTYRASFYDIPFLEACFAHNSFHGLFYEYPRDIDHHRSFHAKPRLGVNRAQATEI